MAWKKVHGLCHIASLEADLAKLEQGACGVDILYTELVWEMATRWGNSSQLSLNTASWGKANPLLHKGLGAAESVILVPRHSLTLEHPSRLQLQRTLLQQLLLQQATAPG